jgi:hypothetical protein
MAIGGRALRTADFVWLCLELNRLGFNTIPHRLIERLLPSLQKAPFLTRGELRIYWFKREHHGFPPIKLVESAKSAKSTPIEIIREFPPKSEIRGILV